MIYCSTTEEEKYIETGRVYKYLNKDCRDELNELKKSGHMGELMKIDDDMMEEY